MEREETPEGRIAAVAVSLLRFMEERNRETGVGAKEPDYADFRDAFAPYVKKEILLARIDEMRHSHSKVITERVTELGRELLELERTMPTKFTGGL